jgi:hypothetical protein
MRQSCLCVVAGLLLLCALPTPRALATGLYGDEGKNVKTGDLNDRDYWQARWDMMMLDLAIKQHQPEGHIGLNLASTINNLNDLTKKYPAHEELKKMKEHAEDVEKHIDPHANRGESWKPGMPWDEANFAQLWINWHEAQMCAKDNDPEKAHMYMTNVMQNYDLLDKPDRLKDYPEDLHKWFDDTKPKAEKFMKELKEKLRH